MENFLNSNLGITLRWIAVLPVAILVGFILVPPLLELQVYLVDLLSFRGSDYFFTDSPLVDSVIATMAYLISGSITAPNYNRLISVILAVVLTIFSLLLLFEIVELEPLWLSETNWFDDITYVLGCIIGSIIWILIMWRLEG